MLPELDEKHLPRVPSTQQLQAIKDREEENHLGTSYGTAKKQGKEKIGNQQGGGRDSACREMVPSRAPWQEEQ